MKAVAAAVFCLLLAMSLIVWHVQPNQTPGGVARVEWVSDENPLRQEQRELFNRSHPGIKISLDPNNQGVEKVIVQSLAGVGPDVFDCYDGYQLAAFARAGIALDMTDILAEHGVNVERDTFRGTRSTAIFDGRVYGVPTNVATDAIWLHKDLFKKAGEPLPKGPWRWPEFIALAKRLTVRGEDGRIQQYGFLFDWGNWVHFIYGFGGHVFTPNGTRCTLDSPSAIAGIQLMHDFIYEHHISPTPVEEAAIATQGGWGSGNLTYFGGKRGAMALGGRWWLAQLRKYGGLSLGVVESPYGTRHRFHAYGRATLINKAGNNVDQAIQFLLYLAGPDYNQLINKQADGVSAFKQFAVGPLFLHDPDHPEEDYNAAWRTITESGDPDEVSPFVDGATLNRLVTTQLDLVKADQKSPASAMKTVAAQINEEIAKTLQLDPKLAERYRLLGEESKP
jgi:multiple sugar transport system substrate-binding protein